MTYAVKADLQKEIGDAELAQLTDRVNGTTIDDSVLNEALARADAEIDSYLATRYVLPFSSVPVRLKGIAMDVTRYYLFDARAPEIVVERYKAAVAWLKDVAAGRAAIVEAAGALIPDGDDLKISVQASDQVFTDDLLELT